MKPKRPGVRSTPYSVLVVDDFGDGRELVAEYLRFKGFTVMEATGGEDAIALALQFRPQLILMDLTMAGLDGWEATRQLKADPRTRQIIVVALSAHALKGDEERARAAGCDGFIPKPVDMYTLADLLFEVLRKDATARSLGKGAPRASKNTRLRKKHKNPSE